MKVTNEILYMPCPCGSGAKFKFCCWPECQDLIDGDMTRAEIVKEVRCRKAGVYEPRGNREAQEACDKGREALTERYDLDGARELFRRAVELDPGDVSAWNNGAICEWESGNVETAAEWQRKGIKHATYRNTFGLASMAIYLHALGRDGEAAEWLARALEDRLPLSRDVVVRVCFALALFRRHRDIVDYATASCMDDDSRVGFFKATALANLGETDKARAAFRKVEEFAYYDVVGHYLNCLKEGRTPRSVREGEWPYFTSDSFPPARWLDEDLSEGRDPFARPSGTIADAVEVLANDCARSPDELLRLIRGREGGGMAELRKGLERLAAADAAPDLPPGVTEAKDEARRGFPYPVPKWRMELEIKEENEPEDDADSVLDGFVLPYFERHCNFYFPEGEKNPLVALLVGGVEDRPELSACPCVTLVPRDRMWDAFRKQLIDYFANCDAEKCLCEVRCDMMYGGAVLSIQGGNRTEVFMMASPEREG